MEHLGTGSVVAGRYRLVQPVSARGRGGVWRAADRLTGREVAVKLLAARPVDDAAAMMMFRLIGMAAVGLSDPGIAQVRDFGEAVLPDGLAVPYLVRDLADGQTLDERLAEGPLPAGEALRIVAAVAATLAVAHRGGAAHGHLVPANIVLAPENVKLTDFGLAALDGPRATAASAGVLSYTAPELAGGGGATPAADMYALGVVFTACLTGITSADSTPGAPGVLPPHAARPEPAVPDMASPETVPPGLAALWARCLGPSPAERPTAAHAAVLSRQALGPRPAAPELAQEPAGPPPAPGGPGRIPPRTARAGRRRLVTLGQVAAATAATSGILALLIVATPRQQDGPAPPYATAPAASRAPSAEVTSSARAAPALSPSPLSVIRRISATIRACVGRGQIRQDVGLDLSNLVQPVATDLAAGRTAPVAQLAETLRAKVATRLGEGAMSQAAAAALQAEISALRRSAGTRSSAAGRHL